MREKPFVKIIDNIESYLCQILLAFFVCLLFLQILLRLVFGFFDTLSEWIPIFAKYPLPASISWGEELSRFSFVWFVFLGATYAARLAAHNRVRFQFKLFPEIVGNIFMLIADGIWIAFNCLMVYYSISVIQEGFEFKEYSPTLNWVMAYVFFIFPIAFSLMSVRIIQVNIMKYFLKIEIEDVDKVDTGDVDELGVEGGNS